MPRKKLTNRQIENMMLGVMQTIDDINSKLSFIINSFSAYVDFQKNGVKFGEYLQDLIKKSEDKGTDDEGCNTQSNA